MISQTDEGKRPEISVVVPVYNVAPYLSACLDSVLGQTFRDFELILVDDGSTDGSGDIAAAYAQEDVRLRVFHHRWNEGLASSLNMGLELSRGKFIAFADADDVVAPEYLEAMHRAAVKFGAEVVAAGFREFHAKPGDGQEVLWTQAPAWLGTTAEDRLHAFLPLRLHIAQWGKLYRRSFLDAHHLAFFSPGIAADVTFHLECLLVAKKYLVLPQAIYYYRVRQNSLEHVQGDQRAKRYAQAMPALMNALDAWMQGDPQLAKDGTLQRQASQRLYLLLLVNLQRITKECSSLVVSQLLLAAMDETPSYALQEAMTYAAVRIPITAEVLEYE